jgi:hypothetical protein
VSTIQAFLDSQAGSAILAMVGVAFADFLTGTFAALRDGTFQLDAIAAFLRKHIWGRVAPISTLLALGYFSGGTLNQAFTAAALAAGLAYVAETASRILGNLAPPKESKEIDTGAEALNPVPKD